MSRGSRTKLQVVLGWVGITAAIPFFVWVPLGFVPGVPSMVDIFGVAGVRIPAAVSIGGLLIAAIGFNDT